MGTYVALLRGINVSGQKKIRMADLKMHFESWGFSHVKTYIQSGNVVCRHQSTDKAGLLQIIERGIREVYGFQVRCGLLIPADLDQALQENPFLLNDLYARERLYFVFMIDQPTRERVQNLGSFDHRPEEYVMGATCIYFYAPHGYGRAKMNNNFFEAQLKIAATTRNLKTVKKLRDMTLEH
jgi:uncharacterized protein (DUF1697 family)